MRMLIMVLLLFAATNIYAQPKSLSPDEMLLIVQEHHPLARQASLQTDFAEAGILASRGRFDPLLSSDISSKKVNSQLYYRHSEHQLTIPTWYGIDVYAGAETVNGLRADPRETNGSVSYIGISIPVGRSLLMDHRRAALKQSEIFHKMSLQEQREVLNNLAADALKAYWNWWQQYKSWQLFSTARKNAADRFELVKLAYRHGERPAIDTLEALTQLQDFLQAQIEVGNQLVNTKLELSAYLWVDGKTSYELPEDVVPSNMVDVWPGMLQSVTQLLEESVHHPELAQNRLKIEGLKVDEKLKKQALLPQVNIKYNQLTTSYNINEAITGAWLQNDYRYGISISMPLRLSEGRGDYQRARIKTEQAVLEQQRKQVLVENKIRQRYNDWKQLQQQVAMQEQKVNMLKQLQKGEEIRFQNGESSLFLINSREAKALEAEQKLIELKARTKQAANLVIWASGNLAG